MLLLDLTVRMARAHTVWYAQTLPDIDLAAYPGAFADLPFITRQDLLANRKDFVAGITHFSFASFTGGTTDQTPLMVERAIEEQQYMTNLLSTNIPSEADEGSRKLGLVAANASHGQVFQLATRNYAFTVNFEQDASFRKAAWLLNQDFTLPGFEQRVSFIQGYFEFVHLLALYLEERGMRVRPGQIRSIACYGMAIPPSRRDYVANFFGAPVHDNFSLSEAMGSAPYDPVDGTYAFTPFVHAEVVDGASGRPVEVGTGELIVTTLFPFTQRFPLIRYRTGDIVFVENRVPLGPLFRVRGRKLQSVMLAGGQILCCGDVMLALENLPFVARLPGFTRAVERAPEAAGPFFRLFAGDDGSAVVEIEIVKGTPLELNGNYRRLEKEIRSAIYVNLPEGVRDVAHQDIIEIRLLSQRA